MKKSALIIALLFSGSVYAAPNRCETLESVCKSFGYKSSEPKVDGRDLYNDCVTLIVSGFPPSDINVNNISASDIKACKDQMKTTRKKK